MFPIKAERDDVTTKLKAREKRTAEHLQCENTSSLYSLLKRKWDPINTGFIFVSKFSWLSIK